MANMQQTMSHMQGDQAPASESGHEMMGSTTGMGNMSGMMGDMSGMMDGMMGMMGMMAASDPASIDDPAIADERAEMLEEMVERMRTHLEKLSVKVDALRKRAAELR